MVMVYVNIELDDFDDDDLKAELEARGFAVFKGSTDTSIDLERIEHLVTCGLMEQARAELMEQARAELIELASRAIGRPL